MRSCALMGHGPMDLDDHRRLHPTTPRPTRHRRPPPSMGTTRPTRTPHPNPRPPRISSPTPYHDLPRPSSETHPTRPPARPTQPTTHPTPPRPYRHHRRNRKTNRHHTETDQSPTPPQRLKIKLGCRGPRPCGVTAAGALTGQGKAVFRKAFRSWLCSSRSFGRPAARRVVRRVGDRRHPRGGIDGYGLPR
jgi:hypothetical protein